MYTLFGNTLPIYKHIDFGTLLMELILVNVIGFGLRYTAKNVRQRSQPPAQRPSLPRRPPR
ncbi:MAG: hypothetical protein AABY83_05765 [Pseudomonadota bacterium]